MAKTVLRGVRVRSDLDEWFNKTLPWRGTLPQFVNACLEEFRRQWGTQATPHQAVPTVISALMEKRY